MILHDIEGYTHVEIGEMLGIAEGTSKARLFDARNRLEEVARGIRAERVTSEDRTMTDDQLNELLDDAKRTWLEPPEPDFQAMWGRIEREAFVPECASSKAHAVVA